VHKGQPPQTQNKEGLGNLVGYLKVDGFNFFMLTELIFKIET